MRPFGASNPCKRGDKMKKILVVLVTFMMAVLTGCGGGSGNAVGVLNSPTFAISGKVTLYGDGLDGAAVTLSGPSGAGSLTVQTQSNGTFTFTSINNGSYTLSATLTGYTIPNQTINVNGANLESTNLIANGRWQPVGNLFGNPSNSVVETIVTLAADHNTLYAGTGSHGAFKSTDGGVSWNSINTGLTGSSVDVSVLAIDPTNGLNVYAVVGGGVFKSTDGGDSWTAINSGITNVVVSSLAIDPKNSRNVYVGSSGGGVFKSTNGGTSWSAINSGVTSLNITSVAIDPTDSQNVYVTTMAVSNINVGLYLGGPVFKSANGGASWNALNIGGDFATVAIDPTNSQTVYVGIYGHGIYKSTDGGASWAGISTFTAGQYITSLVIDPINSQIIYAVAGSNVSQSNDGGLSWIAVGSGISRTTCLAIDPTNDQNVYAGTH